VTAVRTPVRTAARRTAVAPAPARRGASTTPLRVAPEAPASRRLMAVWVAAVVALLVAVLVVTASQALLVQGQDRLDELQGRIVEEEQRAERQQLQLAELQAPERVVAAATERLGMVAPDDVVHLRSDPADDATIAAEAPPSGEPTEEATTPESGASPAGAGG